MWCNFFGILGLCGALLLSLYIEVVDRKEPCILCLLQRASILMIALGLYWNLSFGVRIRHYAFSLASALLGLFQSLWQGGGYVPQFITTVLSWKFEQKMYVWSFVIFSLSLICLIGLLAFYEREKPAPMRMRRIASGLLLCVMLLCSWSAWHQKM